MRLKMAVVGSIPVGGMKNLIFFYFVALVIRQSAALSFPDLFSLRIGSVLAIGPRYMSSYVSITNIF